jgi:HTH-type transcriptional repressor of NAD biosynthesis genes
VKHGLVIGKFYPPHAGHRLLVQTAAALSEHVSVVVMAASVDSIPLAQRVAWLREIHADDVNVVVTGVLADMELNFHDDAIWRAHIELMLEATQPLAADPIDCVFTSESYGLELADRLHAQHMSIDPQRQLMPISATAVREQPAKYWDYLAPCVRAGLAFRVVIIGAESTGKTSLAVQLAYHYRTKWVPEYGREFTLLKLARARGRAQLRELPEPQMEDLRWASEDFVAIAEEQNKLEELAARNGGPVLICDTDAFATATWHARYLETNLPALEPLALGGRRLYLLTHPEDVPFAQDGIRDGAHVRDWMTAEFATQLDASGRNWDWLRGKTREARMDRALAMIDDWLGAGLGLRAP